MPSSTVKASGAVQSFIDSFYAASDVGPSGHQAYVEHYHPKCTLVMGPTEYRDHSGILEFREAGWEKVATRKHVVQGVYLGEKGEHEVMLYGYVDYGFKDGSEKKGVEWAARMELTPDAQDQGKLKLHFYQVYIVSARGGELRGAHGRDGNHRLTDSATSAATDPEVDRRLNRLPARTGWLS